MLAIQQSSVARGIPLPCFSGAAPQSGITPTLKIKLHPTDAGSTPSGTITASDSSGFAELVPSATDFGTVGYYKVEVSGTGIDTRVIVVMVTAYDPFNVLPAGNAGAIGGLPTLINTTNGTMVRADVADWNGNGAVLGVDDYTRPVIGAVFGQIMGNAETGVNAMTGPGVWAYNSGGSASPSSAAVSTLQTSVNSVNTAILNVQNNTFVSSNIPVILERPDSGSEGVPLVLLFADETGAAHDIDAAALPTVTLVDDASTSLASRISTWTHAATGKYTATYTSSASDALENIHWEVTATVNSKLRRYVVTTQLVDTTAVDFTASDRTNLNAIMAKTNLIATDSADSPNAVAAQTTVSTNLDAKVSSRSTYAGADTAGTTTLLGLLTAARAGYLDNLNVGGNVASHADIAAINQSASRTMTIATVGQYAPGEGYTIEMNCFNRDTGTLQNADSPPTLSATGAISGSLAANLSASTNPSTGVYRWTYTVPASPTLEQIRFDGACTVATFASTLSCYAQTVDEPSVVWTTTDQSHLTSIFNKLPAGNIGDATATNQSTILGQTNKFQFDGSNNVKSTPQTSVALQPSEYTNIANELLDIANAIDPGGSADTVRHALRLMAAILLGKVSGAGNSPNVFRDTADTKNRVSATVDSSGNRTAITYDNS